jgi:hypothetical protein
MCQTLKFKIKRYYSPNAVRCLSNELMAELRNLLMDTERDDAIEQAAAGAAFTKISRNNWNLSKAEFDEFLDAIVRIEDNCDNKKIAIIREIHRMYVNWGVYKECNTRQEFGFMLGGKYYEFDTWKFEGRPKI